MRRSLIGLFIGGLALGGVMAWSGAANPAASAVLVQAAVPAVAAADRITAQLPLTPCGTLAFGAAAGSPFAVGAQPSALASGDLNGDGRIDMVTANFSDNTITVLLNQGQGVFQPAPGSPIGVGFSPAAVGIGNLNGDNFPDLVVVNALSNYLTVLVGNGQGGFSPGMGSPLAVGNGPRALAIADVNNDGRLDLVVGNVLDNNVTVLLNTGLGGFTAAPGSPVAVGSNPFALLVINIGGTTSPDLITANYSDSTISVLLGNGLGGFSPAPGSPIAVGAGPAALASGLLNGDTRRDLVVANSSAGTVSVLLGDGTGGFSPAPGSPLTVGTQPQALALADLTGAGVPDLVVANSGADNIGVWLGNGAGGFSAAPIAPPATGLRPDALALADYNNDGKIDIGVANGRSNSVSVLLNICGQPTPTVAVTRTPTATPAIPVTATPTATYPPGGCGSENFVRAPGAPFAVDNGPDGAVAADFNGDGLLDVATANFGANDVSLLLGNAAGGFTPAGTLPAVGGGPKALVSADFNRDGKRDLATANFAGDSISVLLGDGAGGFSPAISITVGAGSGPLALTTGDFNGDGFSDLAVTRLAGGVSVLLGDGRGGFTPTAGSPFPAGNDPGALVSADFNGDGLADVAVTSVSGDTVLILLGNGAGSLSPAPQGPVAVGTSPAAWPWAM